MAAGKIRSILAASDLGPASDEAVRTAAALAERQGGPRRLLVGSVATGVAREAHCPVPLVPPASGGEA